MKNRIKKISVPTTRLPIVWAIETKTFHNKKKDKVGNIHSYMEEKGNGLMPYFTSRSKAREYIKNYFIDKYKKRVIVKPVKISIHILGEKW